MNDSFRGRLLSMNSPFRGIVLSMKSPFRGFQAEHDISPCTYILLTHRRYGDVVFFGCFISGRLHGSCWKSLPGGGFMVSGSADFSGPRMAYLYPDCRYRMHDRMTKAKSRYVRIHGERKRVREKEREREEREKE